MRTNDKEKILIAVSGGIDSAVAIKILIDLGYDVEGVHFNFWHWEEKDTKKNDQILSRISTLFRVPIHQLDQQQQFKDVVIKSFMAEQKNGLTPNPCVLCNPSMKFKLLKYHADALGIDAIATGHYARTEFNRDQNRYLLKIGVDPNKDQSYMLCYLDQDTLARTIFPLGNYLKKDVYQIGKELGLPIESHDESQDLCFVEPENYHHFIKSEIGRLSSGKIINTAGEIVGNHDGLALYTIGQRKGIKVSSHRPYYVIRKEVKTNTLIIGYEEELERDSLEMIEPNWIYKGPKMPLRADVKIRYRTASVSSLIEKNENGHFMIKLEKPLRGITPGQYAVFYDNEYVIGGGKIIS
jgi:tRNA-specific 2-thiouridylase